MIKNYLKKFKGPDKKTHITYLVLRILVLICLIRQIMAGEYHNALLCVLSLVLFLLPDLIERVFKIELPMVLEISILIFIFAAEILGEINNFYGTFKNFDTILHTINGFLAATVGFSLVYILNKNVESINLSPLFVAIIAFSFSMTIGVLWEFFEFSMDYFFNYDTQKDTYIERINTVELDLTHSNKVVTIDGIDKTVLYDKNNNELATIDGYLDIGIIDSIEDLFVNFIGAIVYSIFGYLYIVNDKKNNFAGKFVIRKKKSS